MSKKCCGIIYKDEKFCTMCGKALIEETPKEEPKDEKKVEETQAPTVEETQAPAAKETQAPAAEETPAPVEEGTQTASQSEDEQAKKEPEDKSDDNEDNEDDEDDDYEEDDGTASGGLKFFGTLMIFLAIGAIAAVGLAVYFVMLKPFYREHDINNPVVYQQMATDTDVTNIETRAPLAEVSIDTKDASQEDIATDGDATATEGDASATDADDSENME